MTDFEEDPPIPQTPAPPKAKTSRLVLLMLALNLGGTGFGVVEIMTGAREAQAGEKAESRGQEVTGPIVALDPFITNLDEPGTARYLKVSLQLELVNHDAEEPVGNSKQVIRDVILSHLSGLKVKDTLGAEAKETLRKALMAKMEPIVGAGRIRRVFFQDFVVQ